MVIQCNFLNINIQNGEIDKKVRRNLRSSRWISDVNSLIKRFVCFLSWRTDVKFDISREIASLLTSSACSNFK